MAVPKGSSEKCRYCADPSERGEQARRAAMNIKPLGDRPQQYWWRLTQDYEVNWGQSADCHAATRSSRRVMLF